MPRRIGRKSLALCCPSKMYMLTCGRCVFVISRDLVR